MKNLGGLELEFASHMVAPCDVERLKALRLLPRGGISATFNAGTADDKAA